MPELVLILLNCLDGEGIGMRPYIEHYGMLKHLDRKEDMFDDIARLQTVIAEAAFEDSDTRLAKCYGTSALLLENRRRSARMRIAARGG